jgi:hypothetical protein
MKNFRETTIYCNAAKITLFPLDFRIFAEMEKDLEMTWNGKNLT